MEKHLTWSKCFERAYKYGFTPKDVERSTDWAHCAVGEKLDFYKISNLNHKSLEEWIYENHPNLYDLGSDFSHKVAEQYIEGAEIIFDKIMKYPLKKDDVHIELFIK